MKFLVSLLLLAVAIQAQQFSRQRVADSAQYPGFNPLGRPPVQPSPFFRIIQQRSNSAPQGYEYSFETENSIKADERGEVLADDPFEDDRGFGTHASGHYEYVDPEGNLHAAYYTADNNGFRVFTTTNGEPDSPVYPGAVAPHSQRSGPGPFGPRPLGPGPLRSGVPLGALAPSGPVPSVASIKK